MARGRTKGQVVNNQLHYALANGVQYLDVFRDLSAMNRKLIRQGRVAYLTDMTYSIYTAVAGNGGQCIISALPNDWVTNNAWKKGQAHWLAQQRNSRKLIGQSGKPTWEDFKCYYDAVHRTGTTAVVPGLSYGEWANSKFVYDDGSLREPFIHVQGDDVGSTDVGLVLNYQESRATVQQTDPDLPAEYNTNLYALMAEDENEVAAEVAENMEADNDGPPYDQNDYPGNNTNAVVGHYNIMRCAPHSNNVDRPGSVMCAPLGLLKITHVGISKDDGSVVTAPGALISFRVAYGNYKGLAAPGFGQ